MVVDVIIDIKEKRGDLSLVDHSQEFEPTDLQVLGRELTCISRHDLPISTSIDLSSGCSYAVVTHQHDSTHLARHKLSEELTEDVHIAPHHLATWGPGHPPPGPS